MKNELYSVERVTELNAVRIVPTAHFCSLSMAERICEIKRRIKHLEGALLEMEKLFVGAAAHQPETVEKARELLLELELTQQYLVFTQEHLQPLAGRFPVT